MKTAHHYSEKKFRALSAHQQDNAIQKLVEAMEGSIPDTSHAADILANLKDCVAWMDRSEPVGLSAFIKACGDCTDPRAVLLACARFLQGSQSSRRDGDMAVRTLDGSKVADPAALERAQKILVILEDLRSVFNVGSIFRVAECLSLAGIWLCGITPSPRHPALAKTAMGTADKVTWKQWHNAGDAVLAAREMGYNVLAVETVIGAETVFEHQFSTPLALVLGNESLGISNAVLQMCDQAVSIPVLGWKNSLNVGVAFGIVAYQAVFGALAGPKS